MFARRQRLTDSKLFTSLFQRGEKLRGKTFTIFLRPAKTGRIGFVITKKVSKSSVERNQIKRRLRAVFEAYCRETSNQILTHHALVVLIHRTNQAQSFDDLSKEVAGLLAKIK